MSWTVANNQTAKLAKQLGAQGAGPLPPPWRYDDHYGFGSLSCIE